MRSLYFGEEEKTGALFERLKHWVMRGLYLGEEEKTGALFERLKHRVMRSLVRQVGGFAFRFAATRVLSSQLFEFFVCISFLATSLRPPTTENNDDLNINQHNNIYNHLN